MPEKEQEWFPCRNLTLSKTWLQLIGADKRQGDSSINRYRLIHWIQFGNGDYRLRRISQMAKKIRAPDTTNMLELKFCPLVAG